MSQPASWTRDRVELYPDKAVQEIEQLRARVTELERECESHTRARAGLYEATKWPMTAEQMAARIKDLEAVSDKAYRMLALCFSRIHCLPRTSDTVLAHNIEHLRTEIQTAVTRSGTAPSENVKTQDQPRPDAPYGKPCTCDNSLGSSIPCYVESGGRLGELWYCEKRQRLAVQPPKVAHEGYCLYGEKDKTGVAFPCLCGAVTWPGGQ